MEGKRDVGKKGSLRRRRVGSREEIRLLSCQRDGERTSYFWAM